MHLVGLVIALALSTSYLSVGTAWAKDKPSTAQEVAVDAVVASVNGRPITLHEVVKRMRTTRALNLSQAAADPEFRYMLDLIILEQVINDEAKNRKIDVSDDELNRYVSEVAQRNNLTVDGFKAALEQEKRSFDEYKQQIRIEILRSKLANSLVQGGVGVSDDEVKRYLENHPELTRGGSKLRLSQILVGFSARSSAEAENRIKEIRQRLEDGDDFAKLAREYSESAEAAEGGSLGVLAEEDLNPEIFEAVMALKEGEVSDTVVSNNGLHLFQVTERIGEDEEKSSKLESEVRTVLEREKTSAKAQSYFSSDLFKNHSVDKKI